MEKIWSGANEMMKKGKLNKPLKLVIEGLPLAAAVGASLMPVQKVGQQFLVLIILLWIQFFFIIECFVFGKRRKL
jgi:hypothetical protein